MKKLVVLTGAGISQESGLKTFRDSNGLWENYSIYDVATPEAWKKDKALVLRFYNERRKQALEASPNKAHYALKELENQFEVIIITQNVDNLHEQAGSSNVIHLHGELSKARSTIDPSIVLEIGNSSISLGDKCGKGSQLRPHIVWFGEDVPMIHRAQQIVEEADLLAIIGTSLQVYPAASLIHSASTLTPIYYVDPFANQNQHDPKVICINEKASIGVPILAGILFKQ